MKPTSPLSWASEAQAAARRTAACLHVWGGGQGLARCICERKRRLHRGMLPASPLARPWSPNSTDVLERCFPSALLHSLLILECAPCTSRGFVPFSTLPAAFCRLYHLSSPQDSLPRQRQHAAQRRRRAELQRRPPRGLEVAVRGRPASGVSPRVCVMSQAAGGGGTRTPRPAMPVPRQWRAPEGGGVEAPRCPQHRLLRVVQQQRVVHKAVARPNVLQQLQGAAGGRSCGLGLSLTLASAPLRCRAGARPPQQPRRAHAPAVCCRGRRPTSVWSRQRISAS